MKQKIKSFIYTLSTPFLSFSDTFNYGNHGIYGLGCVASFSFLIFVGINSLAYHI
jgi:hypothetical protein